MSQSLQLLFIHCDLEYAPIHASVGLIEETKHLASDVFPPCLLVVHNSRGRGKNNVSKLTRWQQLHNPLLEICKLDVVAGADNTSLVDTASELASDHSKG
jgi:hypothetical protein